MKISQLALWASFALAVTLTTLNAGCGKKTATVESPAPVISVEKTSFNEVTSQLDPGGNFYMYLGTAQWLTGLDAKVGNLRQTFASMPDLKPEDATNLDKAFDIATAFIKDSGIEDVSGVGMSSVEIEKGMFRNKFVLHHYPGQGNGFLWQFFGKARHPLTGLDLLPADTTLAIFSDTDLPLLWQVTQKEVGNSGLVQAQDWLDKLPVQFNQKTGVKWDDFLNSLGGEFGLVVTLDPSNNIPVPLPDGALEVPSPGLMLVVKVNDDTIFNRIDTELKARPDVISVDNAGLKMRTVRLPIPFIGELRPSAASSGDYLFIASSDALIDAALAVKSGRDPGLKGTDEFKHLAKGLPDEGNRFCYVSPQLTQVVMDLEQRAMANSAKAQPQMAQWMQSFDHNRPAFAYTVGINTPEGCLIVANSSQSYATMALMPAVAMPAMLSAIAIPNFVKARTVSQRNACINNLRQIDAAKQEWALEKGKSATDVPTEGDLLPYLAKWPVCPSGGTYTINAVGEKPTCSVPSHQLP